MHYLHTFSHYVRSTALVAMMDAPFDTMPRHVVLQSSKTKRRNFKGDNQYACSTLQALGCEQHTASTIAAHGQEVAAQHRRTLLAQLDARKNRQAHFPA